MPEGTPRGWFVSKRDHPVRTMLQAAKCLAASQWQARRAAVNWGGQTDEADALVRTFDSATMSVAYQILMPQGGLTLHMPHKRTSDAGASKEDLQMLMPQRGLTDADASEEGFRSWCLRWGLVIPVTMPCEEWVKRERESKRSINRQEKNNKCEMAVNWVAGLHWCWCL